jgi:hypothetical protein
MSDKPASSIWPAVVVFLGLVAAYPGSYLGLMHRRFTWAGYAAEYHLGDGTAVPESLRRGSEWLYAPLNWLDRRLRPEYWKWP